MRPWILLLATFWLAQPARADVTIHQIAPRVIASSGSTRVECSGTFGKSTPRFWNSLDLPIRLLEASETRLLLEFTSTPDLPIGPCGFWIASDDGISACQILFIDDLPASSESESNHQPTTPHPLPVHHTLTARSDPAMVDFFQIPCAKGERHSLELIAQAIYSPMDPVIELFSPDGQSILHLDDSPASGDLAFSFLAEHDGPYLLKVQDNRFAGPFPYLLRHAHFDFQSSIDPLAIGPFHSTLRLIHATNPPEIFPLPKSQSRLANHPLHSLPSLSLITSSLHPPNTPGSRWFKTTWSHFPLIDNSRLPQPTSASSVIPIPALIADTFESSSDQDRWYFDAVASEPLSIQSLSTSLGLPTELRISILDLQGKVLAESPVQDGGDWSMYWTPPLTQTYQLQAADLLHRSGSHMHYQFAIQRNPGFTCSLKFDAQTRDRYLIDRVNGGLTQDILIENSPPNTIVHFSLSDPHSPFEIANPTAPANAKEHRLTLLVRPDASPFTHNLRILADRFPPLPSSPSLTATPVQNSPLLRARSPHIPNPYAFQKDATPVASIEGRPPFFRLASSPAPWIIHWNQRTNQLILPLERLLPDFKSPFLPFLISTLDPGITLDWKVEELAITAQLTRQNLLTPPPPFLDLRIVGEWQGRLTHIPIHLTLQWQPPPPPIPVLPPDAGEPPSPSLPPPTEGPKP